MIKDRNIADDANIQVHKIMGSAGLFMTGELFWVGDSGDAAYNAMRSKVKRDRLYTNLDTCIGATVANRGDVIVLMEGTNQTVSAAAGLALDVSGITIVFLGKGTTQAKITFDTAVTADMDIDAANITLVNPKFVAGIDSLQGPIDVNSTDFTMINAEYHDADDIETIDAVIATAGATRLKIHGYKYFCGAETGNLKQSHIQLNGCDDIDLKEIDIRGDFYVGCIENVTDEVLNARFENIYCENLNATPKPAIFMDADATGSCKNVKCKIASGTTYVSNVGKLSWDDRCEGFMGDGYAGEPLGTVIGTGLEGKIDTIDGYHDVPTANATTDEVIRDVVGRKIDAPIYAPGTTKSISAYSKGTADLQERVVKKEAATMVNGQVMFTIAGGPIEVLGLVSIAETSNDATASTLQYSATPTIGSATTISAASASLANAAAGASVTLAGTTLSTAALLSAGGPNLIANPGTIMVPIGTITMVIGTGSTTGTWAHYLRYKPLATGVTVV